MFVKAYFRIYYNYNLFLLIWFKFIDDIKNADTFKFGLLKQIKHLDIKEGIQKSKSKAIATIYYYVIAINTGILYIIDKTPGKTK